jgi:hypothetical protein
MGDLRRPAALSAMVCLVYGSLTACYMGPDPVQYGGVAMVDGKATAVIAGCGRSTLKVDVDQTDGDDGSDLIIAKNWSVTVTLPGPVEDLEIELFGKARRGWEITTYKGTRPALGDAQIRYEELTAFEPGHPYELNSSEGGPEGTEAPAVAFTTDDLARIGPGEVLMATDYDEWKIVPRTTFVTRTCKKKGPGA